ncbi:oligogalacturonate-specific porin KdgM family protein [Biostraticola tofi]|uniref:Oligogalacturonate-specific porin n=1 Tax=Biostraticola tofi TaxID=466109 RepID=A0A4R3YPW2_9GAMM|nr:oligogalacturonate-specific porin KdgM family protein [Biostraticola tofi]TCV94376.1 oligogalacturonate-specific porin [Biostraticola tofi]
MKIKLLTLGVAAVLCANAGAVSVDLRHEYTDDSRANKDRVLVAHRFDNGFGFSVEAKAKSGGDDEQKPFNDMVDNGSEYDINYQYKLTPEVNLQPGLAFETSSSKAIYKPYLRAQYTFDSGIYVAARYRYEYTRDTTTGAEDEHVNRGEAWLGYRWDKWRAELNYIYKKSDLVKFDNKKEDYEYDGKLQYSINKNWAPYIAVGNVSVRKTTDERQTRYRVGVQYSF